MAVKALKVLQNDPTRPSLANRYSRICIKCGRWDQSQQAEAWGGLEHDEAVRFLFVGRISSEKDYAYIESIVPEGVDYFYPTVLCGSGPITPISPTSYRCCRAYLLWSIREINPDYVICLGEEGLAALTGKANSKIPPNLGREIPIPELPGQLAYAIYHPRERLDMKKPMAALQKNGRITQELKKLLTKKRLRPPKEVTGEFIQGPIVGFDTEFDDNGVYTTAVADTANYAVADIEVNPNEIHEGAGKDLCAHYAQVDVDALVRLGHCGEGYLRGQNLYDTYILAHMQNENLPMKDFYGVDDVLARLYRAPNWKEETNVIDPARPLTWGLEKRKKRCGYDAWASKMIYDHPAIQHVLKTSPFVVEWQHRMLMTYHRMKYTGLTIDRQVFDEFHDKYDAIEYEKANEIEPVIREQCQWPEFSLTNNNHLRDLLYSKGKMALPVRKHSQSGLPSVDVDALEDMIGEPLVAEILEWRKANKLMTTWYGKAAKKNSIPLYQRVTWDAQLRYGYLPVNLGVGKTATLRRQSQAPNTQNWDKETRRIVTSRFRHEGVLIYPDYEKLEVFLLADEIKCDKLKEYFLHKGGYNGIARDLMGVQVTKGDDNYRAVKATSLAANYWAKAPTIAHQLYYKAGVRYSDDWPTEKFKSEHYAQSQHILERYYKMFPKIPRWFQEVKQELLSHGYVTNRFGHRRHLPCPNGEQTPGFSRLLNQAVNFKIQSVAGLVTGVAAVLIEEVIVREYWPSYMELHGAAYHTSKVIQAGGKPAWANVPYLCNEVHDELMVDSPLDHMEWAKITMEERMTQGVLAVLQQHDPTFTPHLAVEMQQGGHWCG